MEMLDVLTILHNQAIALLLFYAISFLSALAVFAIVLYFVVRGAVRSGVVRAYRDIHGERAPGASDNPGQL